MFHVELRQFPKSTRVFNLPAADLHRRFVEPWIAGETIAHDEQRYSPEKAKLTIYEGPALRPDEIGMGRGWGNVTRAGEDVTASVLKLADQQSAPTVREQAVRELKAQLLERIAQTAAEFPAAIALASDGHIGWRASDRLAVAEQAIWELLHEGRVQISRDGAPVPKLEWESVLLAWGTWTGEARPGALIVVGAPAGEPTAAG